VRRHRSVFAYNQPATYTLAAIVQRATGGTLVHYLRRRLFDKLGARELSWLQSPLGRDIGYSGLYATTETVALLCQLYLQGGEWQGEQLLGRWWVTEATRAQVPTRIGDASGDGALGYGYGFWMSRHGYRGDGAYGQYCLVLPDEDAVVAMTAQTRSPGRPDMQTVLTMVWDKLLPAFADGSVAASRAEEALRARLDGLCLPALGGGASPPGARRRLGGRDVPS
jgi:CubicO group peptidase (beta-lactamase class C family)